MQHRARQREPGPHAGRVAADALSERVGDAEAVGGLADPLVGLSAVDFEERRRVPEVVPAASAGRRARAAPAPRHSGGESSVPSSARFGSRPSVRTAPASGCSAPVTRRTTVVLPAPFGPSSTVTVPRGTTKARSLTATTSPNVRQTPESATAGADGSSGILVFRRRADGSEARATTRRVRSGPRTTLVVSGGVAEWFRQGSAKPWTRVRFPSPPPKESAGQRGDSAEAVRASRPR